MNKDFWITLKKFVEPIEETNDKIKTEKEMIISVCEEQLGEEKECYDCKYENEAISNNPCNECWGYGNHIKFEPKN